MYGSESLIGKKVRVTFKSGEYGVGRLVKYNDVLISITDIEDVNIIGWMKDSTGFTVHIDKILDVSLCLPKIAPEDLLL